MADRPNADRQMEQKVRPFRCIRPSAVPEAIGLLQEYGADAILLAGGTDLIVGLRDGAVTPRVVVDVKGARDLPPLIAKADCFLTVAATVAMMKMKDHLSQG